MNLSKILIGTMMLGQTLWGTVQAVEPHNANTELVYLDDPAVDHNTREYLIDHAKSSIMMIAFEHQNDTTGLRIADALRRAAKRGVKIQYIFDKVMTMAGGDISVEVKKLLAMPDVAQNISVIDLNLLERIKIGITNSIHTKLLVIDADTENEKVIIGGRNIGDNYLKFIDSAVVMRAVDKKKNYDAHKAVIYFRDIWKQLLDHDFTTEPEIELSHNEWLKQNIRERYDYKKVSLDKAQQESFKKIVDVLENEPVGKIRSDLVFYPKNITILSNDFLRMKLENTWSDDLGWNNVSYQYISSLMSKASNITFTSYIFAPPPVLLNQMKKCLKRSCNLNIMTDSYDAYLAFTGKERVSAMAAEMNGMFYHSLTRDMSLSDITSLSIREMYPTDKMIFQHRKSMIIDDRVVLGSDNFSPSSALHCEELTMTIKDDNFARFMKRKIKSEESAYGRVDKELYRNLKLKITERLKYRYFTDKLLPYAF